MDFADRLGRDRATFEPTAIDPLLDGDMRFRFELEIALLRVSAVVVLEGALDVDGVCIVPFDQVAVVAVHRPHEIGERCQQAVGQGAPEPGALLRQLEGKIGQRDAVSRAVADQQRLHQGDRFAPVFGRTNVRFITRCFLGHR